MTDYKKLEEELANTQKAMLLICDAIGLLCANWTESLTCDELSEPRPQLCRSISTSGEREEELRAEVERLLTELAALEAQEPVAWARNLDDPQPQAVSKLIYRPSNSPPSDYIPLYRAAGAQGANGWGHLRQYGYAPGNYMGLCGKCGKVCYDMDKRAITCRSCAEAMHAGKTVPEGWQLVPKSIHPLNNDDCKEVMDLLHNPPSAIRNHPSLKPFDDKCDYYDYWWGALLAAAPKLAHQETP